MSRHEAFADTGKRWRIERSFSIGVYPRSSSPEAHTHRCFMNCPGWNACVGCCLTWCAAGSFPLPLLHLSDAGWGARISRLHSGCISIADLRRRVLSLYLGRTS